MESIHVLKYRLNEHPFYEAWREGRLTILQLAAYGQSYAELIREIPRLWSKVIEHAGKDLLDHLDIVAEEEEHIELWDRWSKLLPDVDNHPTMSDLIEKLDSLSPDILLGVIHAFEIQQPEVAVTKKDALIEHYGFRAEDLTYFDEHINEEEHIAFGQAISRIYSDPAEFEKGFSTGSKLLYDALDRFIDSGNN